MTLRSLALLPVALLLTGCALTTTTLPTAAKGLSLHGAVHGGQQPISGAHVYLFAAGSSGYASASTSLLTSGDGTDSLGTYVSTLSDGTFDLTGKYACTANAPVYVLAAGGSPVPGVVNNAASRLMTVLGACPSAKTFAGSIPSIAINEVTTVAAAFAMAPFASDSLHVGTSGTSASIAGLNNAMQSAMQIVSSYYTLTVSTTTPAVSGYSNGLSANGTIPASTINSLADILASCVNSDGTQYSCTQLMSNAKNSAGTAPSDVATAALNIAHNPGANASNLYNLVLTTAPFQPSLAAAPNDWTLSVQYTAPNTSSPTRGAIDGSGNVWFPNSGNNSLTELSPLGLVLSGTGGFTGSSMNAPNGLAVNPKSGTLMVANNAGNKLSIFTASGSASTTYSLTGSAYSVTFDSTGVAYVGFTGGMATVSSKGSVSTPIDLSGAVYGVAVNSAGNAYATSASGNALETLLLNIIQLPILTAFTGAGMNSPAGVATDASGNFWIANQGANSISVLNSSGSAVSTSSGYTGGGITTPWNLSIDGLGNAFVVNTNGTLSELDSSGVAQSPSTGFVTASTTAATSVMIDGSGNVWVPNSDGKIYKFIGLAAPVVTPLSNTTAGTRP